MDKHILDSELDLVYTEIMAATRPKDVFGSPTKHLPLPEQEAVLKRQFDELKKVIDPNQYTRVVDVNAAGDAMVALEQFYKAALEQLVGGAATMEFTVRGTSYHVGERIAIGENSVLYRAIATKSGISDEVVLKIARDADGSEALTKEAELLRSFRNASDRSPILRVTRTLPEIKDTFRVEDRRVNVIPYYHGRRNLREIVEYFDHQVPVGHAAWIARRALALPITAQLANLSHNAITPEHVLVHPITHEPIYLGWGHTTAHSGKYRKSELHQVGTLLWYLFGNPDKETWNTDVPDTLQIMIASLMSERKKDRPQDLSTFFTDFTEAIYLALGKRYRPLKLN